MILLDRTIGYAILTADQNNKSYLHLTIRDRPLPKTLRTINHFKGYLWFYKNMNFDPRLDFSFEHLIFRRKLLLIMLL